MRKSLPFLLTGVASVCFAFALFVLFLKQPANAPLQTARTILTNYSPFDYVPGAGTITAPDLVKASNLSKQGVVYIESRSVSGSYFGRRSYGGSTGSGVIISADGYIATNHHVISEGNEIVVLMEDGRE